MTFAQRPRGVCHLYVGPLTRTGRAVPHARRPVCGARTRRLAVYDRPRGRLCRRCVRTTTGVASPAAAGPALEDLLLWALAITRHDEIHLIEARGFQSGPHHRVFELPIWLDDTCRVLGEVLAAAKRDHPDEACCKPRPHVDLHNDWQAIRTTHWKTARAARVRLGRAL